jgi:hypothetical protein
MSDKYGMATGSGWWQAHADELMEEVQVVNGSIPAVNAAAASVEDFAFKAKNRMNITRVTIMPNAGYTYGGVYLVNRGTAGTANTGTLASKTASAATLSAGVPYTLTLSGTVSVAENEYVAFSRATANGTTSLQGCGFEIEFTLPELLRPS